MFCVLWGSTTHSKIQREKKLFRHDHQSVFKGPQKFRRSPRRGSGGSARHKRSVSVLCVFYTIFFVGRHRIGKFVVWARSWNQLEVVDVVLSSVCLAHRQTENISLVQTYTPKKFSPSQQSGSSFTLGSHSLNFSCLRYCCYFDGLRYYHFYSFNDTIVLCFFSVLWMAK